MSTFAIPNERKGGTNAEIAQLVEHNLAKVGVASSSLVFRSAETCNQASLFFLQRRDMSKSIILAVALLIAGTMTSCAENEDQGQPVWPYIPVKPEEEVQMITPTTELAEQDADIAGLQYYPGMQINVKSTDFFNKRLEEVANAGFKYVELKFKYAYGFEKKTDAELKSTFAEMQRKITDKGLTVWSIHLPYEDKTWTNIGGAENIRKQSVDYILRVLGILHETFPGCKNYVLHASKGVLSPRSESVAQARKSLEEMIPVANSYGVRFCVENLVGSLCPNPEEKGAVLDGIENVYSTFDIGHANCTGHDVAEFLAWEGTRLGTLHIHDTIFNSGNDTHMLVGQGNISKWGEVYRTLLTVNRYRGVFMFEPTDDQSANDVMATYQIILNAYNQL